MLINKIIDLLLLQEYEAQMNEMKSAFELEKSNKTKLERDMMKLRAFYDGKLQVVDGQLADLPSTAEGRSHPRFSAFSFKIF